MPWGKHREDEGVDPAVLVRKRVAANFDASPAGRAHKVKRRLRGTAGRVSSPHLHPLERARAPSARSGRAASKVEGAGLGAGRGTSADSEAPEQS